MLVYAVEHTLATNPFILLDILFGRKFQYAGGDIMLLDNHYITASYYTAVIDSSISDKRKIIYNFPISYEFELETKYGEVTPYSCNFTLAFEDGNATIDYIYILDIHKIDGINYYQENLHREMLVELVKYINLMNGIINQKIKLIMINIEDNIQETIEMVYIYIIIILFLFILFLIRLMNMLKIMMQELFSYMVLQK